MNLPGYDAWKLATPYDMTAAEEAEHRAKSIEQEQDFRAAIAAVLADERGDIYLATIREIVVVELNKLRPQAGEPVWQTQTPIPLPVMG